MVWFPEHITGSQILSIIHFLGPLVHLWASDGATPSPFPKELDVDRKGFMFKRFVHLCWSYLSSRLFDSSFLDLNSCYGIEGVRNTIPANLSPPPFPSYVPPSPRPHQSILISEKAPELYLLGQSCPSFIAKVQVYLHQETVCIEKANILESETQGSKPSCAIHQLSF